MRTFTILLVVFVVASVGAMWLLIEAGVDGTATRYAAGAVFLIPTAIAGHVTLPSDRRPMLWAGLLGSVLVLVTRA